MGSVTPNGERRTLPTPSPVGLLVKSGGLDWPTPEGEGSFSVYTTRLAGLTGAVLGWRPDEFWSATPAELAAILTALAPEPDALDAQLIARMKEQHPDG